MAWFQDGTIYATKPSVIIIVLSHSKRLEEEGAASSAPYVIPILFFTLDFLEERAGAGAVIRLRTRYNSNL